MPTAKPSDAIVLAASDAQAAKSMVESACNAPGPREHRSWAEAAEAAGLHALAFREWLLAARAAPRDAALLLRLSELYRERGDGRRATALLERVVTLPEAEPESWITLAELYAEDRLWERIRDLATRARGASGPGEETAKACEGLLPAPAATKSPREKEHDEALLGASDADLVRMLALFGGREEVHARQWFDPRKGQGGYSPVQQPLTPRVLRGHLGGDVTLGVYPIRLDGTVGFFAIDLDITRRALDEGRSDAEKAKALRREAADWGVKIGRRLKDLGFDALLESSGYKGRHIWVFLDPPQPAARIHRLGELLLRQISPELPPALHLEFFPRQKGRSRGRGLGNLIKLPLGIHRRSGRRSVLLDEDGKLVAEPFELLKWAPRAGSARVLQALERLRDSLPEKAATVACPEQEPTAGEPPLPPLPALAPAPAPWTSADFETGREMAHVLCHCPVLDRLRRQADEERRLDYDEQMVLTHTLGHLERGVLAVNYLLTRVPEVPLERRLKSRLRGQPMSCPKIRQRIPHITSNLACNCVFPLAPEHYPTPTLHLLELPAEPEPSATEAPAPGSAAQTGPTGAAEEPGTASARNGPQAKAAAPLASLEHLARSFQILRRRQAELERELSATSKALATHLRSLPEGSLELDGGAIRLREEDGIEAVEFLSSEQLSREAKDGSAAGGTGKEEKESNGRPGDQ